MDFLGNILAIHLVQDIFERGDVVVIPQGVDAVIHGDIADTVSWEKVLNQMPCLQIVTPQSAEVFRDDKVDLPALNGSQPVSYTHLNMDTNEPFRFSFDMVARTGLSSKDFIAPTSCDFREGKCFKMGKTIGAVSFLQILAPELNDRMLDRKSVV